MARAESLTQAILSAIGSDAIVAVFVGGSVATGEIASFDTGEGVEVYSDIDLYVVVPDESDDERLRARVRSVVVEFDSRMESAGARFVAPSDVGIYTEFGLRSLVPRPGTVCLEDATLLYGQSGAMKVAPGDPASIDPREALYLIENRMTEMAALECRDGPTSRRYAAYHVIKLCADVGTALLVSKGKFTCSTQEQSTAMFALVDVFPSIDIAAVVAAQTSRHDLQTAFTTGSTPDISTAKALALSAWRAISDGIHGDKTRNWIDAMELRCHMGQAADNLREFVAMRSRQGHGKLSSVRRAVGLSRYSAVSTLRIFGVARQARVASDEHAGRFDEILRFVDRLTKTCGFNAGTLPERVTNMNRSLR